MRTSLLRWTVSGLVLALIGACDRALEEGAPSSAPVSSTGPAVATAPYLGDQQLTVLMVTTDGTDADGLTDAEHMRRTDSMMTEFRFVMSANSAGRVTFNSIQVLGPIHLSPTLCADAPPTHVMQERLLAGAVAAVDEVVDFSAVHQIVLAYSNYVCPTGASGTTRRLWNIFTEEGQLDASMTFVDDPSTAPWSRLLLHEFGHSIGATHGEPLICTRHGMRQLVDHSPYPDHDQACQLALPAYSFALDPMGSGLGHFRAPYKIHWGWISPDEVTHVIGGGVYALAPTEGPHSTGHPRALRIPINSGVYGSFVLEYRSATAPVVPDGWAGPTPPGVYLIADRSSPDLVVPELLEPIDGTTSPTDFRIKPLPIGVPVLDTVARVGITVLGISGGTAQVRVERLGQTVTRVAVTPTPASGVVGESIPFTATAYDAAGLVVPTTFTWTSSNSSVATVGPDGRAQLVGLGNAVIRATSSNGVVSAPGAALTVLGPVISILVSPAATLAAFGDTLTMTAVGLDAWERVTPTTFVWTSADPRIATVHPTTGFVTVVGFGTVQIHAISANNVVSTFGGQITVPTPPVTRVTVSPELVDAMVGQTVPFTATAFNAQGQIVPSTYTWTSSNPGVATVGADGRATLVGPGTAVIRATAPNGVVSDSGGGLLVTGPVTQISVTPSFVLKAIGDVVPMSAVGRDALGRVSPTTFTWTSSNPAVVTVHPTTGVATVVGFGSAQIRATGTNGVVSDFGGNFTVPIPAVAWVTVQPGSGGVGVGEGMQFTATAFDAAGRVIPATFTWTTGSSTIAGVTSSGWATGRRVGVTTIRATTPNGKVGSASLQVLRSDF